MKLKQTPEVHYNVFIFHTTPDDTSRNENKLSVNTAVRKWRYLNPNNWRQPESRSVKAAGCGCFLTRAAIFYQIKCENIIWRHNTTIRLEQGLFLYLITQYKIQEANSSELWTNILAVQNRALGRKEEEKTKQEVDGGGLKLGHFPQGFNLRV